MNEEMQPPKFECLKDGFYRYVRHRDGRIAWAMPTDFLTFHRELAGKLGVNIDIRDAVYDIASAGFFQVIDGVVTVPEEVPIIDSEDKSNRSLGLERGMRYDDAELIVAQLEKELI